MNSSIQELKTSNTFYCTGCNKKYTRKHLYDKHVILCNFKMRTQREKEADFEQIGDTVDHCNLVKIVQELSLKIIKMEEKMTEMQKWISKKKQKLNVIQWLNDNIVPTVGFLEWITYLKTEQVHFESLMENNLIYTIEQVFEYNLQNSEFVYPIRCFTEKTNIFYICEKNISGVSEWKQLSLPDLILLLKNVNQRIMKELIIWKNANQHKFDDNDRVAELFNKAVIKLMDMKYTQDATLTRIKNNLYNYLKTDLKSLIEYDFES